MRIDIRPRRALTVIGLSLTVAVCSLIAAPLSAAASSLNISFSIGAQHNAGGNDVVRLTNREHYCVAYAFQSYKNGQRDSNYGFEIRPGKSGSFEAEPYTEGDRSVMKFYRCGHYKVPLATVHFMFARGYKYVPH